MSEYALRLANSQDTASRVRAGDAAARTPNGTVRARGGLRPDGGGVVSVLSGQMNVQVTPFSCWVDAAPAGQVGYPFVCDATKTLAIAAGHATLVRVDTVAVVVKENAYDGSGATTATLQIVQGTPGAGAPAMPTSACIPLRDINVPAGASAGTGGLTSGALGTDRRTYSVGAGGLLPVATQAERDALTKYDGLPVYRIDTHQVEVWNAATSRWDLVGPGGQWVDDLVTATSYNFGVTSGTFANISSGGPFAVTVPAGRTLEVEFRAPLLDTPATTGIQVQLLADSTVLDGLYKSNSDSNSDAQPASLHGFLVGTGAAVNLSVKAMKVGTGTPSVQGGGVAPVRIRHRIT